MTGRINSSLTVPIETPWKLMLSGNFYYQSGILFNALIPHPVYGNNEGFCNTALGICNPRGTADQSGYGKQSVHRPTINWTSELTIRSRSVKRSPCVSNLTGST